MNDLPETIETAAAMDDRTHFRHMRNKLEADRQGREVMRAHYETDKDGKARCTVCHEIAADCFGWHRPDEIQPGPQEPQELGYQGALFPEDKQTLFDPIA